MEIIVIDNNVHPPAEAGKFLIQEMRQLFDIIDRFDSQSLEIDVHDVAGFVITQALIQAQRSAMVEPQGSVAENQGIHFAQIGSHCRAKFHLGQDVALKIHARRNFNQFQAPLAQAENTAFSDIIDDLPMRTSEHAIEGDLPHFAHELFAGSVLYDMQSSLLDSNVSAIHDGSQKIDSPGALADIDEAARSSKFFAKTAHIHITFLIHLGKTQESLIDASSIIKIELIRLIDDSLSIGYCPKA